MMPRRTLLLIDIHRPILRIPSFRFFWLGAQENLKARTSLKLPIQSIGEDSPTPGLWISARVRWRKHRRFASKLDGLVVSRRSGEER
jgi:hypothetical protein